MTSRRKILTAALVAPGLATGLTRAFAAWPERPVSIVVPYPPGGSTDIVGRIAGEGLRAGLGKPVVVENKPGAGGLIGARYVAKAAPDGYTLLLGTIATHSIIPHLVKDLQYDPVKDFTGIVLLGRIPNVLVVNPALPVKDVNEFIAYARKNPGKLNVAINNGGSSIQLAAEFFRLKTRTEFAEVAYQGSSQALNDLLSGQVDAMFDNLPSSLPFIRAGKLRALAVTSSERSPVIPELPTITEAAKTPELADFNVASWFGLFAPARTPAPIVDELNLQFNKSLKNAATVAQLAKLGVSPGGGTPAELAAFVDSEMRKWGDLIKEAGIKLE
jgi:tripartite-type tricarboxylate transporter receptor subunit TctC